jgi:hypothetical protein
MLQKQVAAEPVAHTADSFRTNPLVQTGTQDVLSKPPENFCSLKQYSLEQAEAHARQQALTGAKRPGFQGSPYIPLGPWACHRSTPTTQQASAPESLKHRVCTRVYRRVYRRVCTDSVYWTARMKVCYGESVAGTAFQVESTKECAPECVPDSVWRVCIGQLVPGSLYQQSARQSPYRAAL